MSSDAALAGVSTPAAAPGAYTRLCRGLSRACMALAVAGLMVLLLCVLWQVFGRYVLNSTPTWAESLALVLVLYVTLLGTAVGVRDAGHIGMESLLVLAPPGWRRRIELLIHALVAVFGALMAWQCALLMDSVRDYRLPTLGISEAWRYLPAVLAGVLIVLFSLEHIVALRRGEEVAPTWA